MKLEMPIEVLALLVSGFDSAGDGGIDPFTKEERDKVEEFIGPHRPLIDIVLHAEGP